MSEKMDIWKLPSSLKYSLVALAAGTVTAASEANSSDCIMEVNEKHAPRIKFQRSKKEVIIKIKYFPPETTLLCV